MTREGADAASGRPSAGSARLLLVVCIAANALEASLAVAYHVGGGPEIAPQAASVPPLALFSDLRWLLVYERSWPTFALAAVLVLVGRSLLSTIQLRLAWPGRPPPFMRVLARSVVFTLVLGLLLAPFALLLFGLAAFRVSWLYFAAVPCALLCSLLLHQAAFSPTWWRSAPRLRPVGWVAATIPVVMVAAFLVFLDPGVLAVPVAAAAGAFEALTWRRIAGVLAGYRPRRFAPVAPVAVVVFLVGAVLGAAIGFDHGRVPTEPARRSAAPSMRHRTAVLVANGFSSHYDGAPVHLAGTPEGSVAVAYSYRGSLPSGRPLAYTAAATRAGLPHLAALMGRQVDELARQTGEPVDLVAVSEGTAVVDAYLARAVRPPVGAVVLISPLLHVGIVSYPPAGHTGWGLAAGQGLTLLSSWLAPISTVDLSPQQPFLRSLLALRPSPPDGRPCASLDCRLREVEVVPLADAVAGEPVAPPGTSLVVIAGFHGGDLTDPSVGAVVGEALSGRPVRGSHVEVMLSQVIAGLASAWCVPALVTS